MGTNGSVPTPSRATSGMVSTPHHLASSAGKQALRQGGSAVDAAIAANAVLCVAYPHMAGLGGDGFWLIADTESGDVSALNASGPAGAAATRDRYRDQGGIPERGPAAALTVPGAVDGWRRAHDRHGRLPWRELFTDAIRYASEGVPVSESLARWMHRDADLLRDSAVADVFTPGGTPLNAGTRLVQSDLGSTLERLANKGARSFYEGTTAERLANGNRTPLQPSDFAAYEAEWVEPIRGSYRGRTVYELPPNTQGISTLQILGILANYDVETWKDCSAAYLHHLVEATKLAFADRDEWVSDPAFVEAPLERLLSSSYLANRSGRINAGRTLPASPEPGIEYGGDAVDAGGDTVYLCTADDDGLVVSTIQSIFLDFGSGVVPEDTGVFLQNRGALFSLEPADANRLEPGKRSFHTLIPALLYDRKEPTVAFGTMGGHGQPQTQAAFLTRLLDFGYDIQRAISAPRWLFGRTWSGGSRTLTVESRIGDRTVDALRRRGHDVSVAKVYDEAMGHAQALRVNHETGVIAGAADPRSDGSAVGF